MTTRQFAPLLGLVILSLLLPYSVYTQADPISRGIEDSGGVRSTVQPLPTSLTITEIKITRFPNRQSNADNWDWDPVHTSGDRPDPFVEIESERGRLWKSRPLDNKISGPSLSYRLSLNGSLSFTMNTLYTITLFDKDTLGEQEMGNASFRAIDAYRDNPSSDTVDITVSSREIAIAMRGVWNY